MKSKINRYIQVWERRCYSDLPDEVPIEIDDLVPSYKRIAKAILKNDLGYIGINPPDSQYYGILKSIELNKKYIKRMTKMEIREEVYNTINVLIDKNCYIKGYDKLFRICDKNHNPIKNIPKSVMQILLDKQIVVRDGLIFSLNIIANPFSHQSQITFE